MAAAPVVEKQKLSKTHRIPVAELLAAVSVVQYEQHENRNYIIRCSDIEIQKIDSSRQQSFPISTKANGNKSIYRINNIHLGIMVNISSLFNHIFNF